MTAVEHRFGPYGGQFVPETLMPALAELEAAWIGARADAGFRADLERLLTQYAGRPTPLYEARRLSEAAGRPIYLKREDLLHTGAHKINNALGQVVLAGRLAPENVREAIDKVRPWAVDTASGTELEPGIKDPEKVRRFLEVAAGAPVA